jgi:CRP/FNR family transcriptional regulator, cyclic AMP receptor protein
MNLIENSPTPAALEEVAEHPFLQDLSKAHLEALAACAMRLRFDTNHVIFREGDPANRFYLIIKGRIAIEAHRGEKHFTLQTIGDGSILGWSWLFAPFYVHFDARALEPTEAVFFYGTRLREMCEADHDLGFEIHRRIARVLIERLVATENRLIAKNG